MNRSEILSVIGDKLAPDAVNYGPSPEEKLVNKFGVSSQQANAITSFYSWQFQRATWKPLQRSSVVERQLVNHAAELAPGDIRERLKLHDVAYHEARHTTVALAEGVPVSEVAANRDGTGYCQYSETSFAATIKLTIAGPITHADFLRDEKCAGDREMILQTMREHYQKQGWKDPGDHALLEHATAMAHDVFDHLRVNKDFCGRLTWLLVNQGVVKRDEISALWALCKQ